MPKGFPKNGINKGWFKKGIAQRPITGSYKICQCGKSFYCEKSKIIRKKYCSIKCRCNFHPKGAKWSEKSKKRHSEARKGIVFSLSHKQNISKGHKGIKFTEKHLQKLRGKFGEKSPRWIKDRSLLVQNEYKHLDSRYRHWMFSVKRRDGWKCKIADLNCNNILEAHHILAWRDYPELRYEINNGITLCKFHHPRKRIDEQRLAPVFQELVKGCL